MRGEFLSLETAEKLANGGTKSEVITRLDENEYSNKINDVLNNHMKEVNELIITSENELIIKLLFQRISTVENFINYCLLKRGVPEETNQALNKISHMLRGEDNDR